MHTTPSRENASRHTSVEKLQEFLRSEISAVETYELALKSVTHVGLHRTLQEILSSHYRRTLQLRERIAGLGAEPEATSGIWGAFAKVFQAGADLRGERVAIAALEEGEDRSVEMYSADLKGCDAKTQKLVNYDLLPEQRRTHDLCRTLKTYVSTPS